MNALVFNSPILDKISRQPVTIPVEGHWFKPVQVINGRVLLYLHGGGYAFYTQSHTAMIAYIARAAKAKTFALDYPLIPENPFPAQLLSALQAYQWLLETCAGPEQIVVAGDSAGGNLALSLLLSLRRDGIPQPKLAVLISPWTDVNNPRESIFANQRYDWVNHHQADKWAEQYCAGHDPNDPMVSPVNAALSGLAPIYIQSGEHEMLIDMICQFHKEAQSQGVDARLDVWEYMIHDFQAFAQFLPEAKQALQRIGEEIDQHLSIQMT